MNSLRSRKGTVEYEIAQQIKSDPKRFASATAAGMRENFLRSEQGALLTTPIRLAILVAEDKEQGCKFKVNE